ncbi:hypothetical protein RUM43_000467, partial [Polyplax serrata]
MVVQLTGASWVQDGPTVKKAAEGCLPDALTQQSLLQVQQMFALGIRFPFPLHFWSPFLQQPDHCCVEAIFESEQLTIFLFRNALLNSTYAFV